MALVGGDAGVDRRGDEYAGLGRWDEERLWPGASFALFAFVVLLSLRSSILIRKRVNSHTDATADTDLMRDTGVT